MTTTPETRTTALQLAVDWAGDRVEARRFHPSHTEIITVADEFAEYITHGKTPAEPAAVVPLKVYDPEAGQPIDYDEAKARGLVDTSTVPKPGPRPGTQS